TRPLVACKFALVGRREISLMRRKMALEVVRHSKAVLTNIKGLRTRRLLRTEDQKIIKVTCFYHWNVGALSRFDFTSQEVEIRNGHQHKQDNRRLRSKIKNQLVPVTTPLIGFSGEITWPIGQIQLLVKIRDEEHSTLAWMNFVVVRSPSSYNGIIRRPGVRKLQAVLSKAHGMLKLPVEGGVITLKSSRMVPLECAMVSRPERKLSATKQTMEERIKVAINPEYLPEPAKAGKEA
nr:reverse transcriptase domain-containing protein [Tanacetum cinerariifolium]